jgi:hypothetical protein
MWPLHHVASIVEVGSYYHDYDSKWDFLISSYDLPRLVVEFQSMSSDERAWARDNTRLLIQGASVVRFANSFLRAHKKEKDFIFVAISIGLDNNEAVRHLLFQEKGSQRVCGMLYMSSKSYSVLNFSRCIVGTNVST